MVTMAMLPDLQLLIGLGSNLDPATHVPRAIRLLRATFGAVRLSTFYHTRPLGDPHQPPYVNGVILVGSPLPLAAARAALRAIEHQCGRVRHPGARCAARTLDLDLLAAGDLVLADQDLPAPGLLERDFCLIPAAELLPDWVHPTVGQPLRLLATERFPQPTHIIGPVHFALPG
jgi:2-amino-4-hydroxy-6-hydroxymethyldihydropteridine diphosphokinase